MVFRLRTTGVLLLALLPSAAWGATGDSVALPNDLNAIYQRLLSDPSDRALNRKLIELAVQAKDYDAAIGAVERLIFYEPNNAALQLEAANLYIQIKSYAAAAGYLKDALALPGITDAERKQAEALLAQADRGTAPSPWSGYGQVGVRYQTNANHGSVDLGLNEPFPFEKPKPDWNTFALGTLGLTETINKNLAIEASLSGYYADQMTIDRLDLGFAEFAIGPRLSTEDDSLSVKPYGIVQGILLGGQAYQSAVGGGVLARWTYADDWWIEPQFEYKARTFYDSEDYPQARDQTGDLLTYAINANGRFSDALSWSSRVAYNDNTAEKSYQSYDQVFATAGLEVAFDFLGKENWVFSPFTSVTFSNFKGVAPPEKYAGLHTIRKDVEWTIGANLEIPWRDRISLGLAIEYASNQSNLDRNDYENLKVVIGPQGRF